MITQLTDKEREQILADRNYRNAIEAISACKLVGTSVTWMKSVICKAGDNTRFGIEREGITLDGYDCHVFAVILRAVPTIVSEHERRNGTAMFLKREARPLNYVCMVNLGTVKWALNNALPIADSVTRGCDQTVYIPNQMAARAMGLQEKGKLALAFNMRAGTNTQLSLEKVGLDIPFIEGVVRLDRECLKHGRFKPQKPLSRQLLDGAVWLDTNNRPLE